METLVSESEYKSDHYHSTEAHGPMWTLLNQMLHIIVLVYTLFGMIRFKVIFIRMVELVRWISLLTVCLNWYISIKFALIGMLLYFFNMELESREITHIQFNCSLDQYENLLRMQPSSSLAGQQHDSSGTTSVILARLLHHFGGPYRLLANRAALMYGFFSISIYIMLALFPVEHYYFNIGFNYIRFVLNDAGCLQSCYDKKQRHVDRLNNWSRNLNSSMITLSMKRAINQRELRSSYVYEHVLSIEASSGNDARAAENEGGPAPASRLKWFDETYGLLFAANRLAKKLAPSSGRSGSVELDWTAARRQSGLSFSPKDAAKLHAPVKSLRHTLATNHSNEPSYNVKVANENLKKFKPYVRSESWFKISMINYPIFIFFYFTLLMLVIGAITIFVTSTLQSVSQLCLGQLKGSQFQLEGARLMGQFSHWCLWDQLTFLEGKYCVFALSCASSFYCSYYFGTILELLIWIEEIAQQLNLSRVLIEFLEARPASIGLVGGWNSSPSRSAWNEQRPTESPILESLFHYHDSVRNLHLIGKNFNQFGGLNSIWAHGKFRLAPQSERLRKYELMAIRLAAKKQTILRATYVNLNMFFDELNDTRFMTTIILQRTSQIVVGFALMVSITRSQFEQSVIYLSVLLFSCLAILNLYLICAALINSSINKLLPQVHALISVSIRAGTDHDLLEFWLRHIQAYGLDKDAMSYKIYGYKVTWSTILNVSVRFAFTFACAFALTRPIKHTERAISD